MTVRVFHPRLHVTLVKTIQRRAVASQVPVSERFAGVSRRIDLAPWLGDGSSVRTSKSIHEPAGGFAITLLDRAYISQVSGDLESAEFESLYGLIEPMDLIEIRMASDPTHPELQGLEKQTALIMRGFVSEVRRSETQDQDGKPVRNVFVTGQDYGKIWQMLRVLYLPSYVIGETYLTNFKLFEAHGAGFSNVQKSADFIRVLMDKIINPYLDGLLPANSDFPRGVNTSEVENVDGSTSVTASQNDQGSIYQLATHFGDVGLWNELFLDEREDGVFCVYRPNAYKDAESATFIKKLAFPPAFHDVSIDDVQSIDVSRSDKDVANYFWVWGPLLELNTQAIFQLSAQVGGADAGSVKLEGYPNSDPKLYGIRLLRMTTSLGDDRMPTFKGGRKEADVLKDEGYVSDWAKARRLDLIAQNKDNVVFEKGTLTIRGHERIRPGQYARVRRGRLTAEYYIEKVDHEFFPFQHYKTVLHVDRGTGFIERIKQGGGINSPYLSEMGRSVYR